MVSFSRKTDYALLALARLAEAAGRGQGRLSARAIASSEHLPLALLMNLLKVLHQAGLLNSVRGSRGGYAISRPPETITVGQVVRAIEGPVEVAMCCHPQATAPEVSALRVLADTNAAPECPLAGSCRISGNIQWLNARLAGFFDSVTLADLVRTEVAHQPTLTYAAISA